MSKREPIDPFFEEMLEKAIDPKAGDRVRLLASEFKGFEGVVAKVYKNGHILAAFTPNERMKHLIMNRNGYIMLRMKKGEYEIFGRKEISDG